MLCWCILASPPPPPPPPNVASYTCIISLKDEGKPLLLVALKLCLYTAFSSGMHSFSLQGGPGEKGDSGEPGLPGSRGFPGKMVSHCYCVQVGLTLVSVSLTDWTTHSRYIPDWTYFVLLHHRDGRERRER